MKIPKAVLRLIDFDKIYVRLGPIYSTYDNNRKEQFMTGCLPSSSQEFIYIEPFVMIGLNVLQ